MSDTTVIVSALFCWCFIISMSSALVYKVMLWSNLVMIKIVIIHSQGYDLILYKCNNRETLKGKIK